MKKVWKICEETTETRIHTGDDRNAATYSVWAAHGYGITAEDDWRDPETLATYHSKEEALEALKSYTSDVQRLGSGQARVTEVYVEEGYAEDYEGEFDEAEEFPRDFDDHQIWDYAPYQMDALETFQVPEDVPGGVAYTINGEAVLLSDWDEGVGAWRKTWDRPDEPADEDEPRDWTPTTVRPVYRWEVERKPKDDPGAQEIVWLEGNLW